MTAPGSPPATKAGLSTTEFRMQSPVPSRMNPRSPNGAAAAAPHAALELTLPAPQPHDLRTPPHVRPPQGSSKVSLTRGGDDTASHSAAAYPTVPNLQMPPYATPCSAAAACACAGGACCSGAGGGGRTVTPSAAAFGAASTASYGVGAATSVARLSAAPGRASRCCFGDTEHHVDAPKSPIKGHLPMSTIGAHAAFPVATGTVGAHGHWGPMPPDPNRLFGAAPVSALQPATLQASELLAPGMIPPPTLPESPKDPSSPNGQRAALGPRAAVGPSDRAVRPPDLRSVGLPIAPGASPRSQAEQRLARSRSELAIKPLRSVGRFSTAIDPSKLSPWQYQSLQRTRPDAPLAKRAVAYQATKTLRSAHSEASLVPPKQLQRPSPSESGASTRTARSEAPRTPSQAAAVACEVALPTASTSPRSGLGTAPARHAAADPHHAARAAAASPYGLGAQFPFGPSAEPMSGLGVSASEPVLGGISAAPRAAETSSRHPAAARQEAAALLEEADEFIQLAEAALVHVSPQGGARASTQAKARQRRLGALPPATAKEVGQFSGGAVLASNAGRRARPLYETGEPVEKDPFPDHLMLQLQQVPGANLQILRLMRRGDWRVKG